MSNKGNKRKYNDQFKADAVNLVLYQNYSRSEVGKRLGIDHATIARWIREHKQKSYETTNGQPSTKQLQEEIKRLKKNQRLTMEREILKKAAAFFAKESS